VVSTILTHIILILEDHIFHRVTKPSIPVLLLLVFHLLYLSIQLASYWDNLKHISIFYHKALRAKAKCSPQVNI
jgi:hypothetical protein